MDWNDLPRELQINKNELPFITVTKCRELFEKAKSYGCEQEFIDAFWSAMQEVSQKPNLQGILRLLELDKRRYGRQYNLQVDDTYKKLYKIIYNSIEHQIDFLVKVYGCHRYSKPYLIE